MRVLHSISTYTRLKINTLEINAISRPFFILRNRNNRLNILNKSDILKLKAEKSVCRRYRKYMFFEIISNLCDILFS